MKQLGLKRASGYSGTKLNKQVDMQYQREKLHFAGHQMSANVLYRDICAPISIQVLHRYGLCNK